MHVCVSELSLSTNRGSITRPISIKRFNQTYHYTNIIIIMKNQGIEKDVLLCVPVKLICMHFYEPT